MAATTISRPTLTDDTGDLTSGNIVSSAFFGANVYDVVDSIFTLATVIFEGSTAGARTLRHYNTNSGTAAITSLQLGNSASSSRVDMQLFGGGYTTSGSAVQDSFRVLCAGDGGLTLGTSNAAGVIRLLTGSGFEAARLLAAGHMRLTELSADPGTGDMTTLAHAAIYMKNDKFVIAYNNAGTMTYVSIALNGSATTWVHNTTAP